MQRFNKVVALLLCVVMLIGFVPVSALAADGAGTVVDAAIIFSDLHTSMSDYKESTLKGILNGIKNAGVTPSSVTSAGDAFSVNEDSTKYTGYTSTLTGYIQSVFAGVPVNYVWSDHDRYAVEADGSTLLDKTSRLVYGAGADGVYGTDDDGNYYIYSLSMGDLCSYDRYSAGFNYTQSSNNRASKGFTSTVAKAIENFKADAAKLNKDRPLFITSHQPLFDNRNDNAFAEDWFDAINEVAEGMDVAFFYGHNHKYDTGSDYYYAKGSKMNVATADNWNWNYEVGQGWQPSVDLTSEQKTLNFTHMCAGYMAPASTGSTSGTTREGVAVAITIYDDAINYTTYNSSGVYTGNYALNETVEREHAVTVEIVEKTDTATGITVAAPGITGLTVTEIQNPVYDSQVYNAYASYDITVGDYVQGTTATVTIPTPAGFDKTKSAVVLDQGSKIATDTDLSDGITFTTNHFSTYDIAQRAAVTADGNLAGNAYTQQIMNKSELEAGVGYLIVADEGDDITLTGTADGNKLRLSGGINTSNQNLWYVENKQYLRFGESTTADNYLNIGNGAASVGGTNNRTSAINEHGNGLFSFSRSTYYLNRYGGSNSTVAGGYNQNNPGSKWRIYKVVNEPGAAVTLSVSPASVLLQPDTSLKLTAEVLVDGVAASDYKLTYSGGNSNVTVSDTGVITGVEDGDAVITVTLTEANGKKAIGTIQVQIPVTVSTRDFEIVGIDPMVGSVERGAGADTPTGSIMTVTYDDGTTEEIPVTVGMITGDSLNLKANGTYGNLTVTYGGKTVEGYALNVVNVSGNNYPEYPNEGAVKVGKTGTGIDFQSSGIAQVEISASGVPMKRGVDIIVMLDMSSSMNRHSDCGATSCTDSNCSKVTRLTELKNALVTMQDLLKSSGNEDMMRIAIADFNGFFGYRGKGSGTPYDRDQADNMGGILETSNSNHRTGVVYNAITGNTCDIGADAFVDVSEMDITKVNATLDRLKATQGTNYDHGFDVIYQLGHAIKEENKQNGDTDRELVVIFMSDGAPNQYNYYHSIGGQSSITDTDDEDYKWNKWLQGTFAANQLTSGNIGCATHSYYYDDKDHDGDGIYNEHRMATAIKGDPNETYEVIRKSNEGLEDIIPTTNNNNLYDVPGLGATMYAVGFHIKNDGKITAKSVHHVLSQIPSSPEMYIEAEDENALTNAFHNITTDILYAAYNARFVDQMGENYDLQMKTSTYEVVEDGREVNKTLAPKIEIISYDIYTAGETIPAGKHIGDRKGTYKVLETVTFNADGTEAYSDQINGGQTNILADGTQAGYVKGVIYAKTFLYNTNHSGTAIDGVSIPTGTNADGTTTGTTNLLPSETFYWKMGTVKTSELAMRYYVYLTGSMEGTREGGSYPTNEYATLYYDNYLGNPCRKDTVSPVMPWKEANVSYAFYLVDENGNIIVNQTTGQTGSFANKIAVTNPVVYETVLLNSDEEVSSIDIASLGVLPEGYTLFDYDGNETGATYTVNINSNTTGSWEITTVKDVATTYVTQYDPNDASAYSNDLTNNTVGDDYTHTVVWFAVLWKVQALPDTVVIDYGLPVDIAVLANDMFGENGKLAGIGDLKNLPDQFDEAHTSTLNTDFGTNYTGTYGSAKADAATGKVRYSLNTMQMDGYEKFAYAVNYTGATNPGYYYDTVTVIPATTIYYEDSFLTFAKYNADGTVSGDWDFAGEVVEGATQSEDRPGQYSLTDANNIYGYDGVNLGMTQFSLGQARKVHVDANSYATAAFTFYGTGFDVISMTSNTSGVLSVEVKDQSGASVKKAIVNTYYGYKREPGDADNNGTIEEGEMIWVPAPDVENAIYQVPVIQIEELTYGKYDVLITATYMSPMDKTTDDGYDLYLDAIRIYDPAYDGASDGAEDSTIEDAYLADHEGWPSYIELRNGLISKSTLGNADTAEKLVGEVFIDGNSKVGDARIADYVSYGPNNEVYLASGQSIAFIVNAPENIDRIHIGISSADGNEGTYTIKNIARYANAESVIEAGQSYGEKTYTVNTSTDMYYDMTGWKNDIVVITNTGDSGIISLTNIKSTYISNPANNVTTIPGTEAQTAALNDSPMLRMAAAPLAVNAEQETTAPAEVVETAEPELTYVYMTAEAAQLVVANLNADAEEIPDETEPTVPDETEPEETEPTAPDETEPEETEPTAPDETEPEETEPTVPEETEPEVFEPAYVRVKLSKTSIKVGQKVLVTVTTSADVDYVIINGTVVTAYDTGFTGNRIWKRNVTGTRAGTLMIDVTCCNASDVAAQTVTQQVKVNSKTVWDYIFDLFD